MDASESPGSTPSVIPGSVWVRTDGHRIAVDHVEDSSLVVWYERDPKINPGVRYEPNGGWYTTVSQMVKHVLPMDRFRIRFSHVREGIDVLPLDSPSL